MHIGAFEKETIEHVLLQRPVKIRGNSAHGGKQFEAERTQALPSTRLIAVESFAQLCSSVSNCFFPEGVSE